MATEPKSTVFDFERYGVFLRTARQRAGYNRAEEFCDTVTTWTGVKINKEALYRIEKGVQPPTVEQLIAFGLILFHGKGINSVLNKTELHHCVTPYAEFFASREGDLSTIPSFDGLYYEEDEYGRLDIKQLYPDEMGSQYLDEYYYDRLFNPHKNGEEDSVQDSE